MRATRGQPNRGLRDLSSTMACMSASLGPSLRASSGTASTRTVGGTCDAPSLMKGRERRGPYAEGDLSDASPAQEERLQCAPFVRAHDLLRREVAQLPVSVVNTGRPRSAETGCQGVRRARTDRRYRHPPSQRRAFSASRASIGDRSSVVESESKLPAQPALIITDLEMPRVNGIELCRRVRQTSSVPIVVVAGSTDRQLEIAALDCGADDYLVKPMSPATLLARVRVALRRSTDIRTVVTSS